jgi:hypothetical protein
MAPLPIITCGSNNPQVLNAVKPLYLPEYESNKTLQSALATAYNVYIVIHAVTSSASGAADLPHVLQGQAPPSEEANGGTGNYSQPPVAIFIGALYGDAEIEEMRQACQGLSSIPWLQMDMAVPKPPLGPGYGEHVVQRVKACMNKIEAEGKLDCDGVWLY